MRTIEEHSNRTTKSFSWVCLAATLSGCSNPLPHQPPDYVTLSKILDRVKLEVADYNAAEPHIRAKVLASGNLPCGGDVHFKITEVDLKLATTSDVVNEGKIGLAVPVGPSGGTVTPSLGGGGENNNSVTTIVVFYPTLGPQPAPSPLPATLTQNDLILSKAIQQLRLGMLRSARNGPCFTVEGTGKDKPDDSVTAQLIITRKISTGLALQLRPLPHVSAFCVGLMCAAPG